MNGYSADRASLAEQRLPGSNGAEPVGPPRPLLVTRLGLRTVLAGAFGLLGLVAALAVSLAVGDLAGSRLRADIGAEFAATAERAADLLDRGLFERLRDIQIAAAMDNMSDPAATPAARRAVLRRLQETYPDYALLFFVGPDGRMLVSSSGALEGIDVGQRSYFLEGRAGPFVGEVHDGSLMAALLGRPADNPPRFVDLAAPVKAPDGSLLGVVVAHLYWEWAEGIEHDVMAPVQARHPGAEALILAQDGQVLLGPPERIRAAPLRLPAGIAADLAAGRSGSRVEPGLARIGMSGDAAASPPQLVGYAPTRGHRDYRGLGWSILVRQEAAAAFAPARHLAWTVMFWGLAATGLAVALGWLLAGIIARPLVELAAAAGRLRRDPWAAVPAGDGPRELVSLAGAIAALVAAVRGREAALRDGAARLCLATEGNGLGTWEFDLVTGLCQRSPQHDAIFGYPAPLPEWRLEDFLGHLAPEEREAVAQDFAAAVAGSADWRRECRILRAGDAASRWIACRGAPMREPDGTVRRYAGVVEDITDRKAGERALELLVRELDHRVKNQFAVFDSLVQFTARRAGDPAAMAAALRGRVHALAAAHDLVQVAAGCGPARGLRPTSLAALAEAVLGPFGTRSAPEGGAEEATDGNRIGLHGPPVSIGPTAAAALALALHELATNAARHGALARPQGRVTLRWEAVAQAIRMVWRETGGPALEGPPDGHGFGMTLVRQCVTHQLGGQLRLDWTDPAGLAATLEIAGERLAR